MCERGIENNSNCILIFYSLLFFTYLYFRLGLIRARLAGARLAKGDVLVFLDAHCECVVDWLQPLVQRIKEKRTSVLTPIIDVIEAKNFYYSTNGYDTFQVINTLTRAKILNIILSESEITSGPGLCEEKKN